MNDFNFISALNIKDLAAPREIRFIRRPSMAYKFPKMDKVEPGRYFSEVKHIEEVISRKGEYAVDVCYDIVCSYQHARYMLGLTDTPPQHYKIKQRIIRNSDSEAEFIVSLGDFYDLDDNSPASAYIGLTELYSIGYFGDDDCIGSIHSRSGIDEDTFLAWYQDTYVSYDY